MLRSRYSWFSEWVKIAVMTAKYAMMVYWATRSTGIIRSTRSSAENVDDAALEFEYPSSPPAFANMRHGCGCTSQHSSLPVRYGSPRCLPVCNSNSGYVRCLRFERLHVCRIWLASSLTGGTAKRAPELAAMLLRHSYCSRVHSRICPFFAPPQFW